MDFFFTQRLVCKDVCYVDKHYYLKKKDKINDFELR